MNTHVLTVYRYYHHHQFYYLGVNKLPLSRLVVLFNYAAGFSVFLTRSQPHYRILQ